MSGWICPASTDMQKPAEQQSEPIEESPLYVQHLRELVQPLETLKRRGYVIRQLSSHDLEKKRRCGRCKRG